MYGRARPKKQFCKFHQNKKCDYFCHDHKVLLCSYCLRDKHRDCQVADDHEYKNYYGKKVKEVKMAVEAEKNELIAQTHSVISAIDAGIARLEKYKKEIDVAIDRMGDMKCDVEHHKTDIRKTTRSLEEIDRQMLNAHDLRTCQQCHADIDLEKMKFERKQRKLLQVPTRLSDEIDVTLSSLQRKLKSIRNGVTSQLTSSKLTSQHDNTRSYKEPSTYYLPFLDLQHKVVNKKPRNPAKGEGRLNSWPNRDESRQEQQYRSHSRFPYIS